MNEPPIQDISLVVSELAIDTRKIQTPQNCLFVAIKGALRDGHQFIGEAYRLGVRHFLVSEKVNREIFPEARFMEVQDTLKGLQDLAIQHRNQFHLPVIGITGSNGKTIIKEWLFELLAPDYRIVRNPKSYNSQIGVPLSIWQIRKEDSLGIFEAGISQPGEMEELAKMIQPTLGLFTNIGDAHSEGFENRTQKIREKLKLFEQVTTLFYCRDHQEIHQEIEKFIREIKQKTGKKIILRSWSKSVAADLRIKSTIIHRRQTVITGYFGTEERTITIPFTDEASIENAIHCWNILKYFQLPDSIISERLLSLQPVAMRLEKVHGINHTLLINDTYNSDLTSLQIALNVLSKEKQFPFKTLILSDLLQVGENETELYQKVARWVKEKGINRIIGIGPAISKHKDNFIRTGNLRGMFFGSTTEFLREFTHLNFGNEAILLKGARDFKFEKISHLLEQKIHKTVLEINLSAIVQNVKTYRSLLPPEVKIMAMVKAFSYGSGSTEVAHTLENAGIEYFGVAYIDEGVSLRKNGITTPIMVMNPEKGAYERMISWNLEPEIYSLEMMRDFLKVASALKIHQYPIHLMMDTGMHRLGFGTEDIEALIRLLTQQNTIRVVSIFSHLSGSGSAEFDSYTDRQITMLQNEFRQITAVLPYRPMLHILNSAGIVRHTAYHFDMVRLGLGMHGVDSSNLIQNKLENTTVLKTTIAQIHRLQKGDLVGYDCRGIIKRESRIATVNIGYADGYLRDFGNSDCYMLVHGRQARVIGSICMDMCMLDVTDIPSTKVGDEVIVFGKNPDLNLLAKWANTIPYEIMTGISQRVNRVYFEE